MVDPNGTGVTSSASAITKPEMAMTVGDRKSCEDADAAMMVRGERGVGAAVVRITEIRPSGGLTGH
jgi:hypothetical protein